MSKKPSPATSFWLGQGLSMRASNALARRQVSSWEGLQAFTIIELLTQFPGLGKVTVGEIQTAARQREIELQPGEPRPKGKIFRRASVTGRTQRENLRR